MKILIAHDGSVASDTAIEDMRRAGLPQDAKAFVVCIAGEGVPHQSQGSSVAKAAAETAGNRIQSHFPKWELSSEAFLGSPAEVILKTSGWWRPDLLIVGSDTFALQRSLTSGVSLDLVHRARCSVRISRTGVPATSGPIRLLIGHNGSKACEAVIHEVARRCWPDNTEAHIISVVDTTSPQHGEQEHEQIRTAQEDCVNRLRGAGLTVLRRFIDGDPRQALLRESERCKADAIFVGPRCLHGMGRFLLGSVATAVVTRARSTVEVVRKPS